MTDIVQVSAGRFHTVGLKSDGTVVAVGANNYNYGQTDVGSWSGITQVAAGITHTVGLRSNGMVVAVGENLWGQSNVGSWNGIIQVAAGESHTVGLSSDGTVVAAGDNLNGQLNIESWTEITHVAAGFYHTVGLKADGNVVAVGADNFINYGQTNVGSWNLQGKPIPDIRAKGFNGPIWVSATTPLSVTVSLDPGNFTGYKAEWWIGAKTPFGWYSYVYPAGWEPGIHLCIQKPLFNLSSFEVFNRTLPPGDYTFYYVLDGQLNGQLDTTRLDSVQVHVQE
jgi:alpha-tubulin suppressor-like RCC1 family protein